VVTLVAYMLLTGCGSPVSKNPSDYVGEYVYNPINHPVDTFPEPFASFVILKRNHTAVWLRFVKSTGQVLITERKWRLLYVPGANEEDVLIGSLGLAIERSGSTIRLRISDDVDEYYEKVR
jgi:hypothetical protein